MSASDTKLAVASVASGIQSIGQARAALGVVTQVLQDGYAQLDRLTSLADVRDTARSLLDSNNAYAAKIYATWTDEPDLQDEEISLLKSTQVATCLEQARSNVRLIEDIAAEDIWNFVQLLQSALREAVGIAETAGTVLASAIRVPLAFGAALLAGLWPIVLLVGFAAVIFFWARGRIIKEILKAVTP